jgi:hypothetical protein
MTTVNRSGADYYDIHLGFWTNWSDGKVQGSTLTISRQDGNLLVAFVALFVAASGKSMWRLVCFLLHRYFSSPTAQDGLYHQRQAILQNSETSEDGAWRLLQLLWVWRRRSYRPFIRLLPPAIIGAVLGFGLVVSGIFSSQLTSEKGAKSSYPERTAGLSIHSRTTRQRTLYSNNHISHRGRLHTSIMRCNATLMLPTQKTATSTSNPGCH